jgi:hypothetical protein
MKNNRSFRKAIIMLALLTINTFTANSQNVFTQTVRGSIVDADTKSSLTGATIILDGLQPTKGTTADIDGNFRLEGVPVGRHNFKVSFIGYEPYILSEILVGSGKEVVLNIELNESALTLNEVVVRASSNKDRL